jgi:hypothetical protein
LNSVSLRAKRSNLLTACLAALLFLGGCQTASKKTDLQKESDKEVMSAIGSVTEGLTNSPMNEQDLKRLGKQVQKDPQAASALKAVNSAFSAQDTGVKYCPVDGKRYSSRLEDCPDHKVKLLPVE